MRKRPILPFLINKFLVILMLLAGLAGASPTLAEQLKIVGVLGSGLPIYEEGSGKPIGEIRRGDLANHLPIPIVETSSMGPYVVTVEGVNFAKDGSRVWVNPADVKLSNSASSSARCNESMGRTTQQSTGRGFTGGCSAREGKRD